MQQQDLEFDSALEDVTSVGKVRNWKGKKKRSQEIAEVYNTINSPVFDYHKISEKVYSCADVLVFNESEGKKTLRQAWFCKNKLCAMCNWRRALKHSWQASLIIDKALEDYPKARFIFLTLTVKNVQGDSLSESISDLSKAFDRLFRRAKVGKQLLGYLRSLEVTYNEKNNTYHPHIHVLMMVKSTYFNKGYYIKQDEWSSMWQESCRLDYTPVVDVRVVKTDSQKGVKGAVLETAKYPVKPIKDDNLNACNVKNLYEGLFGKRQIGYGGVLREIKKNLKLDSVEDGNLVDVGQGEGTEGLKIVYMWDKNRSNYFLKDLNKGMF